jgi:hypothetical protein
VVAERPDAGTGVLGSSAVMAKPPMPGSESEEPPRDVLAAEEFAVGDSDPHLHEDPPHDVLAADEFAVPGHDPRLHHHGPVPLPTDPTGIAEPHDVLAAEEFAMPAPRYGGGEPYGLERRRQVSRGPAVLALLLLALLFLRRRRN